MSLQRTMIEIRGRTLAVVERKLCLVPTVLCITYCVLVMWSEVIKSLIQETHSKIKVADAVPSVDERVIVIFSSEEEGW
jgi:hypothetical protein